MARGLGREHEATRSAIITAAGRLISEHGVEALTFRRAAAGANVSVGRVQHYFPDRSALVQACFDDVQDRVRDRLGSVLADGQASPIAVVTAVLRAMIPRTSDDHTDLRIVALFEAHALIEPAFGYPLREGHAQLRKLLEDQITAARTRARSTAGPAHPTSPDPARSPSLDPAASAAVLLATAEGLSTEVLHGQLAAADADQALDLAVQRLLPAPGG